MPAQKRPLHENLHHRHDDDENAFDKEQLRPKLIRAEPGDEFELLSHEDGNEAKQQVEEDDEEDDDDNEEEDDDDDDDEDEEDEELKDKAEGLCFSKFSFFFFFVWMCFGESHLGRFLFGFLYLQILKKEVHLQVLTPNQSTFLSRFSRTHYRFFYYVVNLRFLIPLLCKSHLGFSRELLF